MIISFRKTLVLLTLLIAALILPVTVNASQAIIGGTYTFTTSVPVAFSSFPGVGLIRANKVTFTMPSGVCNKLYIGSSSMDISTNLQVGKILFPVGCSAFKTDSWSSEDTIQNTDGLETLDYYVQAAIGTQINWEMRITGFSAAKRFIYLPAGPLSFVGFSMPGSYRVEVNVIPGNVGKINISAYSTFGTAHVLNPMYYTSPGVLSTPYPESYSYQSSTGLNGTIFVTPQISTESALFSWWLLMT